MADQDFSVNRRSVLVGTAVVGGVAVTNPLSPAASHAAGAKGGSPRLKSARGELLTTPPEAIAVTSSGKVRGFRRNGIYIFRGLPYGADPSGASRFQPAVPPKPWSDIRSTLSYGGTCPQPSRNWNNDEMAFIADWNDGHPDENCLTLNIWSAGLDRRAKKPVLVWLHGGGFVTGSSYELPGYEGSRLAARELVVVSINHRLGAFGFMDLSHVAGAPYAKSGNVGMLDIVLALRWVRDNIAAFGGDPDRVTIAGQSGGGAKVSALMAMPDAKGLFHRAVVMSGSLAPTRPQPAARAFTDSVFRELNIKRGDVDALTRLPASALVEAGAKVTASLVPSGAVPGLGRGRLQPRQTWAPVADGAVLPVGAWEKTAPPISADVPLLVGNVRDEFKLSSMVFDDNRLAALVKRIFGEDSSRLLQALEQEFPHLSANEKAGIVSGIQYHNAAVDQALLKAAQGAAPVYSYWFTYNPPTVLDGRVGAPHCADIAYFFDNASRADQQTGNTAEAHALADAMSNALVRFAATGNPSQPGLAWPAFTAPKQETMVFDARSRVEFYPGRRLFEAARHGA